MREISTSEMNVDLLLTVLCSKNQKIDLFENSFHFILFVVPVWCVMFVALKCLVLIPKNSVWNMSFGTHLIIQIMCKILTSTTSKQFIRQIFILGTKGRFKKRKQFLHFIFIRLLAIYFNFSGSLTLWHRLYEFR